jgi:hypothetical protein
MKKHLELTPWYHVTAFDSGCGLALTSHDKSTSSPSLTVRRSILESSWTVTAGGSAQKHPERIYTYLHKQMKSINIRRAHPSKNEMVLLLLLKRRYSWEFSTPTPQHPINYTRSQSLQNIHGNNIDCAQLFCLFRTWRHDILQVNISCLLNPLSLFHNLGYFM